MQKVVRVDGDRAVPEFLLHLPKPLVLGALALGELGGALHTRSGPTPDKCLAMAHRGGWLVPPRTLQVLRGDVSEEAPVRWVQLPEVSDTQDVETSERPVSSRIVKLLCSDAADDIPQLQVHVSQELCADHDDFVDDAPSPLQDSLSNVLLPLQVVVAPVAALVHGDATSVMDRAPPSCSAITACKATTWNSTPMFHLRTVVKSSMMSLMT